MGHVIFTYSDYDGETSTVRVPGSDLTAVNIDTEYTEALAIQNALGDVLRGKLLKRQHVAKTAPQGVGAASSAEAQREEKALVMYYDSVTFQRASMELPAVDMTKQNPDYPGVFWLAGASNNHADWDTLVAALVAFVPGPGGNPIEVEKIIHVGRNL